MTCNGTWTIKRPTETGVVELFVGKTMWHQKVRKYFSKVAQYPMMLEWLKDEEGALPDIDVWGEEKSSYTFTDLAKWMDNRDREVRAKGKAKSQVQHGGSKETVKAKGKAKIKDDGGSEDDKKSKKKGKRKAK